MSEERTTLVEASCSASTTVQEEEGQQQQSLSTLFIRLFLLIEQKDFTFDTLQESTLFLQQVQITCQHIVECEALFSKNDTLEDLPTSTIKVSIVYIYIYTAFMEDTYLQCMNSICILIIT